MQIKLIDEAKQWYKLYSIWFLAALGLSGDIYNLAVSFHLASGDGVSSMFAGILNFIGFVGAVSRLIKQNLPALPTSDVTFATDFGDSEEPVKASQSTDTSSNPGTGGTGVVTPVGGVTSVPLVDPLPVASTRILDAQDTQPPPFTKN